MESNVQRYTVINGVALGASSTRATPTTKRPKSWFNFWDYPAVSGNSKSSGTYTPGPQVGGIGANNGGQAAGAGAARQGNTGNSNSGLFKWFQNSAVDPPNTDSSTVPNAVNKDVWANPDVGPVQNGQHGAGGNYFKPNGGYNPNVYDNNQHSGEQHGAHVPMVNPDMQNGGMAGGGGWAGNHNGATGGNLPLNARSVGSGAAAGTLVGVAVAIVVLVTIFAGAAYVLTRQRRNGHLVMANV
ncbi:hypothetical protein BSL78_20943 [Apostichopus japonicus]|uniref:Uncharacterized protein n=1 Tax=Stichopus japonicus TaxID=307972 RepID=A0A2G8K2G0_STIJA|nr:hypothetical protein BSL78_20943 [Apostichopus japonicus]